MDTDRCVITAAFHPVDCGVKSAALSHLPLSFFLFCESFFGINFYAEPLFFNLSHSAQFSPWHRLRTNGAVRFMFLTIVTPDDTLLKSPSVLLHLGHSYLHLSCSSIIFLSFGAITLSSLSHTVNSLLPSFMTKTTGESSFLIWRNGGVSVC